MYEFIPLEPCTLCVIVSFLKSTLNIDYFPYRKYMLPVSVCTSLALFPCISYQGYAVVGDFFFNYVIT